MIREGGKVYFTEEDKRYLTVKKFSDKEIHENKSEYKKVNRRKRILPLSLLFVSIAVAVCVKSVAFFAYIVLVLTLAWLVLVEIVNKLNYRMVSDGYYIELIVDRVRENETHIEQSATTGANTKVFYSIEGTDCTTGYKCVYYLDKDEIKGIRQGEKIRTMVKGAKL